MKLKVLSPAEFEESKVRDGKEQYEYIADWHGKDFVSSFVFMCLRCEARVAVYYCPNCNTFINGGGLSHGEGKPLNCDKCGWSTTSWECPKCQCVNPVSRTAFALCEKPGSVAIGFSAAKNIGCALLMGLVGLMLLSKIWIVGLPLLLLGFGVAIAVLVQLAKGSYKP